MDIQFKKVTGDDDKDFELIACWENDDEIKYHIRPNFNEGEIIDTTAKEIKDAFLENKDKEIFMIICDEKKIGSIDLNMKFNYLYSNKYEKTSWIGICIGDKDYRGKGIGSVAMKYLEKVSKELGATRIELGVFNYNEKAIKLYEKMEYKVIGEIDDFIYYNGKWHKDIRMEKYI